MPGPLVYLAGAYILSKVMEQKKKPPPADTSQTVGPEGGTVPEDQPTAGSQLGQAGGLVSRGAGMVGDAIDHTATGKAIHKYVAGEAENRVEIVKMIDANVGAFVGLLPFG